MTVNIIISGNVQGVGFRQYIKHKAKKLNIKGWIKNLPASSADGPDGQVEAVLVGETKKIEEILDYCRNGPFLANVKTVEVKEVPDQDFVDFNILK